MRFVDLNYGSRGLFLGVSKTLGVTLITCVAQKVMAFRIRDFTGKTDQGISLGANLNDLIRVYGIPSHKEAKQGNTELSYSKLQADFTLVDDKLVRMIFHRPRPGI